MGSKKRRKQVAGHWYAAGMHLVFCHKIDSLETILVGEKSLWYPGLVNYYQTWDPYDCCRMPDNVMEDKDGYVVRSTRYAPTLPPCTGDQVEETCYGWATHSTTETEALDNKRIYVNNLNLFGGEDKGGGIQGYIDLEFGGETQGKNDYLLAHTSGNISAHRNVFGMVLRHVTLSCNTAQIKHWAIRAKRMTTGDEWRTDLQEITGGMNPAHIIRDCLTDVVWGGLGISSSDLSDFSTPAVTLDNEDFGLSFAWRTNQSVAYFINIVLTHINAMLFESYQTGLFTLKLLRDDYGDIGGLPVLNTSNIISLESFDVKSTEESVGACTIKYTNPILDKDASVTVSDPAAIERMGGEVVVIEKEYYGCRNSTIAVQIANRELNQATLPLASITIIVNRTVYDLDPGDVFSFSWEPYGFENVVMRATAVDYGSTESNVIRIDAVMDVFAFGDVMISPPDDDGDWEDPNQEPTELTNYRIEEATYFQMFTEHAADIPSDDNDACYLQIIAEKETEDMIDFEFHDKFPTDLNYELEDTTYFSTQYILTEAVIKENTTLLKLNEDLNAIEISNNILYEGSYGYLGDELVMIYAFTENSDEVWVARGIIDTVPQDHAIGTTLQLISDTYHAFSSVERMTGDEVYIKLLPSTFVRRLLLSEASDISYICEGRAGKPYAPGGFNTNDEQYPEYVITNIIGGIIITWKHRDRTQQESDVVPQMYGNIGPEAGVTYNVRIYDSTPTLIVEGTGITSNYCVLQFNDPPVGVTIHVVPAYSSTYVKASSTYSNWYPYKVMNPALITTSGAPNSNIWMAGNATTTQKFNIDYGEEVLITRFRLINTYSSTDSRFMDSSIKNFSLYGTNDATAFANTTYSNTDDLFLLGDFTAAIATDYEQYQNFILDTPGTYRYYILRFHDVQVGMTGQYMNIEYLEFGYDVSDLTSINVPEATDWYSIELESERDTLISHNQHEHENIVVGYGKHYGRYYGTRPTP